MAGDRELVAGELMVDGGVRRFALRLPRRGRWRAAREPARPVPAHAVWATLIHGTADTFSPIAGAAIPGPVPRRSPGEAIHKFDTAGKSADSPGPCSRPPLPGGCNGRGPGTAGGYLEVKPLTS